MSQASRSVPDGFDLVHSFVTSSLEGELTEDEIADFENLLQADSQLRRTYVRYLEVTAQIPRMLAMTGDGGPAPGCSAALPAPPEGSIEQNPVPGLWSGMGRFLGDHAMGILLVALLVVGSIAALWSSQLGSWNREIAAGPDRGAKATDGQPTFHGPQPATRSSLPVARLVRSHDCRWLAPGAGPTKGGALVAGQELNLRSGLAEIDFALGAHVVLEGPAVLTVVSDNAVRLDVGKISVVAPDSAIGFTVSTPWTRLVDLGTEFAMEVDLDGLGTAHVFQGEVALDPPASPERRDATAAKAAADGKPRAWFAGLSSVFLRENQSLSVRRPAADGQETVIRGHAQPARFVRREQLIQRIEAENALSPFRQWQRFRDDLRRRDDVVAYYDFQRDDGAPSVLYNRARTGRAFDGAILPGTQWSEGRFPGKHSLSMVRPGSGVRVDFQREFRQITLLAWVRIDRLSKVLNGLMMSDGEALPDVFRWQIRREGRVFAYCGADWGGAGTTTGLLDSEPAFTAKHLGRWCLLAVVRDQPAGIQRFYLNADPIGQRPIATNAPPARLGSVTIGGWNSRDFCDPEGNHDRALEGCVDELAIFDTALSAETIRDFYETNKPR